MEFTIPDSTSTGVRLVSQVGDVPSYLKCFDQSAVYLIFGKRPSLGSSGDENCLNGVNSEPINDTIDEKCDLTGDPLQVDLGHVGDESIQVVTVEGLCQHWSPDESKHYALPIREARRLINKIFKNSENALLSPLPVYVVCKGDDVSRMVLIGASRTNTEYMSSTVHVIGTLRENEIEGFIQKMVEDHLTYSFYCKQVDYSVKMSYNLYGNDLNNAANKGDALRHIATDGNIYVNIFSSKNKFIIRDEDISAMEMHVTIVAGHPLLKLNFLWNELIMLHDLLELSNGYLTENEDYVICDDPLSSDEILRQIEDVISLNFARPVEKKETVDLQDLRPLDLVDKLWNILIRCHIASDLISSFNFLFEELLNSPMPIKVVNDDCSTICTIIRDIAEGRLALTNISLVKSIELLSEIGARKLKYDFEVILGKLYPQNKKHIDTVWETFYMEHNIKQWQNLRTTRVTRLINNIKFSLKPEQLAYLSQLYVASEILYLVRDQVNLSDDGLHSLLQSLQRTYVSEHSAIMDFNDIIANPLQNIEFKLEVNQNLMLQNKLPSRWTFTMKSDSYATAYDLSDSPIFPPAIYDFDVPEPKAGADGLIYYVTKMSRSRKTF